MKWWNRIQETARRKGRGTIAANAPRSHAERAVIAKWGDTATLRRQPLLRQQRKEEE